jgi:hypothetical protein
LIDTPVNLAAKRATLVTDNGNDVMVVKIDGDVSSHRAERAEAAWHELVRETGKAGARRGKQVRTRDRLKRRGGP